MSPKYQLSYFTARGAAEPARYMFAYLGIEFEDKRFDFTSDEWKTAKPSYPWGVLPVLKDGDFTLSQSQAIMAYIGKKHNLDGANMQESAKCLEYMGAIVDMYIASYPLHMEKDEGKKAELVSKLQNETMPKFLPKFEKFLKANGGKFLVGGQMTYVDFVVIHGFEQMKVMLGNPGLLDNFPTLKNYSAEFFKIQQIKEWVQKRPVTNY